MKLLAIGDFHGRFPQKLKKIAENVDLVLSTGDYGGSDEMLKMIFKHLGEDWTKFVSKKKANTLIKEDYNSGKKAIDELDNLGLETYSIHGNWDFEGYRTKERYGNLKVINYSKLIKNKRNITFLKRGTYKNIHGLNLFAFGGMLTPYILSTTQALNKKKILLNKKREKKERLKILSKGKKGIDIFLAHYTPYKYFDKVKYKGFNPMNGKHVGIKAYTDFIKKFQPKVFICGHMHEYQGLKKLGKTLIVATGAAHDNKAAIIDFPLSKKGKPKVKFIK